MMKLKWLFCLFLMADLPFSIFWFSQGCVQKVPALTTMAVRPSPTVCGYQALYNFTNGPGCWQVDTGTYGATSSVGLITLSISNTETQNYSESLQAAITNTGASRDGEINVNFSPAVDMDGKEMVLLIYVSPSLAGMAVQPYAQTGFQGGEISVTPGSWVSVGHVFTGSSATLNQIGIQFKGIPANVTGDVWIDSVTIFAPATPTPTASPQPTATPSEYWYFASSTDLTNWSDTGLNTYNGTPVTGVLNWASGGFNGATGCLTDAVTFTGTGVTDSIQYTFPSPLNFSGMNLTTIQGEVWIDSSLDTGSPYVQVYVSSGAWGYSPTYTYLTPNAWTQVTYQPKWSNTGENSANLESFWFTTRPGSSDTVGYGNIKLDDVILN